MSWSSGASSRETRRAWKARSDAEPELKQAMKLNAPARRSAKSIPSWSPNAPPGHHEECREARHQYDHLLVVRHPPSSVRERAVVLRAMHYLCCSWTCCSVQALTRWRKRKPRFERG
jgi:hypothetical protein